MFKILYIINMITKFKIFENKQLDDIIIDCINDNTYRPLELIPDKEHTMKVILNNFWNRLDKVNLEELIKLKFPLNVQDNDGYNVLMSASITAALNNKMNIKIIKLLIDSSVDLNIKNKEGDTALILATINNHKEIVKLLIVAGADVNLKNNKGNNALLYASLNKNIDIAKLLIDAGTNINIENINKITALTLAQANFNEEMIKLLKSKGAKE